jgi:hypothetical protein
LGGTNGENAAHASIFLGNEHLDLSLGRVRNPESARAEDAQRSKFRAIKPRIEEADVHVRFGSKLRENSDVELTA